MIALKVRAADDAGITPLLCVGEEQRACAGHAGGCRREINAAKFVYQQIAAAVGGDWDLASRLVIAYEPVWAIGAAEPASAEYVSGVVRTLRELLGAINVAAGAAQPPVIYGGSAKPGLLPTLERCVRAVPGRFAHDAANFGKVLDEALSLSALPEISQLT